MTKSMYSELIRFFYRRVTKKDPGNLTETEMAKAIIECFGNPKALTQADQELLEDVFRNHTDFENKEEKTKFLIAMEDSIAAAKPH